jgi:quinol monooxygenase YgiN
MEGSEIYTHAEWRVRPGEEAAFIAAWESLAAIFSQLPHPPQWGTLLRSTVDPSLFYSFGPWRSAADVATMRANPAVQAAFASLQSLCESMHPGTYERVRHVVVEA